MDIAPLAAAGPEPWVAAAIGKFFLWVVVVGGIWELFINRNRPM